MGFKWHDDGWWKLSDSQATGVWQLMRGEHHSARKRSKRGWPWSRFTPPVSSRCARRRLSVSSEHTACTWQLQASIERKCRLLWCRQLLVLDTRPPLWSKGQASRLSWQAYIESWMSLKATNTRDPVTSINIMHSVVFKCGKRMIRSKHLDWNLSVLSEVALLYSDRSARRARQQHNIITQQSER